MSAAFCALGVEARDARNGFEAICRAQSNRQQRRRRSGRKRTRRKRLIREVAFGHCACLLTLSKVASSSLKCAVAKSSWFAASRTALRGHEAARVCSRWHQRIGSGRRSYCCTDASSEEEVLCRRRAVVSGLLRCTSSTPRCRGRACSWPRHGAAKRFAASSPAGRNCSGLAVEGAASGRLGVTACLRQPPRAADAAPCRRSR